MKYFKNTKDYALSFRKGDVVNGELVDFDCLRVYRDTGNIATTGITAISEEDLAELEKNHMFKRALKDGELIEVAESEVKTGDDKLKEKEAEIKELKQQLKEADKGGAVEKLKKAEEENASLKAQLEALKKANKDK